MALYWFYVLIELLPVCISCRQEAVFAYIIVGHVLWTDKIIMVLYFDAQVQQQ